MIKNANRPSCKTAAVLTNCQWTCTLSTHFRKNTQISNFPKIRSVGAAFSHAERRVFNQITFRNFANAPKTSAATTIPTQINNKILPSHYWVPRLRPSPSIPDSANVSDTGPVSVLKSGVERHKLARPSETAVLSYCFNDDTPSVQGTKREHRKQALQGHFLKFVNHRM